MQSIIFGGIAHVIGRGELAMTASRHIIALGVVGVILAIGFLLVIRPAFWAPSEPSIGKTPMTRGRVLVVYGLFALFSAARCSIAFAIRSIGHGRVIPCIHSRRRATTFDDYRLYGVPKDNPDTEVSLFVDEQVFAAVRSVAAVAGPGRVALESGTS